MKKIIIALLIVMLAPCLVMFSGCFSNPENTPTASIVSMSVNPEIEFMLDKNDNIITVRAKNSDADAILTNLNLDGKNIDEAVDYVLTNCIVTGKLDITGDDIELIVTADANDIVNRVKEKVQEKVTEIGSTLNAQFNVVVNQAEAGATHSQHAVLVELASEISLDYTEAELEEMTDAELMNIIKNEYLKYKDLTVEEMKEVYATAKSSFQTQLTQAKQTIENIIAQLEALGLQNSTALENAKKAYNEILADVEEFVNNLIAQAKQNYATVKAELEATYENLKTSAYAGVKAQLDAVKNQIGEENYNYWVSKLSAPQA